MNEITIHGNVTADPVLRQVLIRKGRHPHGLKSKTRPLASERTGWYASSLAQRRGRDQDDYHPAGRT